MGSGRALTILAKHIYIIYKEIAQKPRAVEGRSVKNS
jgi:hypothetical protein